jgi:cation diffusion facilitator family transporter
VAALILWDTFKITNLVGVMHIYNLYKWQHEHRFNVDDKRSERNTWRVIVLTISMMFVEIAAGYYYGSMALLADGWHMGTHAAALGITAFTYWYARKHADNPDYSFGTGKVGVLGGFASAIVLLFVAILMAAESFDRIINPVQIHFNEALIVAIIGLVINLISAVLLEGGHQHSHDHGHDAGTVHHDHNLRAAYLHVIADALTSVLAISALLCGKMFGWVFLDPVIGIVGALVISKWSFGLLRDTSNILLDRGVDRKTVKDIAAVIEADSDNRVSDIHVWIVGSHQLSAIISIVTHFPKDPEYYKNLLTGFKDLVHVTVEVNESKDSPCVELK